MPRIPSSCGRCAAAAATSASSRGSTSAPTRSPVGGVRDARRQRRLAARPPRSPRHAPRRPARADRHVHGRAGDGSERACGRDASRRAGSATTRLPRALRWRRCWRCDGVTRDRNRGHPLSRHPAGDARRRSRAAHAGLRRRQHAAARARATTRSTDSSSFREANAASVLFLRSLGGAYADVPQEALGVPGPRRDVVRDGRRLRHPRTDR